MKQRHQPNEFRVSVLMPSGSRTSKKYSHLGAAVKFMNKVIDKWPGAKLALDVRKTEPWEAMPVQLVPAEHRWER